MGHGHAVENDEKWKNDLLQTMFFFSKLCNSLRKHGVCSVSKSMFATTFCGEKMSKINQK